MKWTIAKLLILLIFFATTAVAEDIDFSDGVITNILVTMFFYDTYEEMYAAFPDEEHDYEAISLCERLVEQNIAYCHIHQVMPTVVDGEHTLSFGHEVEHGAFGEAYHE